MIESYSEELSTFYIINAKMDDFKLFRQIVWSYTRIDLDKAIRPEEMKRKNCHI